MIIAGKMPADFIVSRFFVCQNTDKGGRDMYQNPYNIFAGPQAGMNPYQPQVPQMQVTKVNGAGGANAFSMGPNSSALLLDASGTMIWAVTTDGAGYKTVAAYDIIPHKDQEQITYEGLESRIKKLEDMINDRHSEDDKRGSHERKPADDDDTEVYERVKSVP